MIILETAGRQDFLLSLEFNTEVFPPQYINDLLIQLIDEGQFTQEQMFRDSDMIGLSDSVNRDFDTANFLVGLRGDRALVGAFKCYELSAWRNYRGRILKLIDLAITRQQSFDRVRPFLTRIDCRVILRIPKNKFNYQEYGKVLGIPRLSEKVAPDCFLTNINIAFESEKTGTNLGIIVDAAKKQILKTPVQFTIGYPVESFDKTDVSFTHIVESKVVQVENELQEKYAPFIATLIVP
jgi:hypothetical protein